MRCCNYDNAPGDARCRVCGRPLSELNTSERSEGRRYDVYRRSDGTLETIKHGFSWPALFGGAIWAWVKGMVGIGFALLGLGIILRISPILFVAVFGSAGAFIDFLISIGVIIWVGSKGNEWRRRSMDKRGFELIAQSVQASSGKDAIRLVSAGAVTGGT